MDELGAVFLVLLLLVFIISNIIFSRKLKNSGDNHLKLKITFFFSCIITIVLVFIAFFIFESSLDITISKLGINNAYAQRIAKLLIILPLNSIANYFLAKFYLKKTKRTNEIELIGKE